MNNPATWVGEVVPGATDDVIIVSPATVSVTADANVRALEINGILIVNNGLL